MKNRAFTIPEVVVSMLIVGIAMILFINLFVISQAMIVYARHRATARQILSSYMEQEIERWSKNYNTIQAPLITGNVIIDDRGNANPADDLLGVIAYDPPAPPPSIQYSAGPTPPATNYRIIGFFITWPEQWPNARACTERAITYVAEH